MRTSFIHSEAKVIHRRRRLIVRGGEEEILIINNSYIDKEIPPPPKEARVIHDPMVVASFRSVLIHSGCYNPRFFLKFYTLEELVEPISELIAKIKANEVIHNPGGWLYWRLGEAT